MAKGKLKKFRKDEEEDYSDRFERKYTQRQRTFAQRQRNQERAFALDTWKAEQQ